MLYMQSKKKEKSRKCSLVSIEECLPAKKVNKRIHIDYIYKDININYQLDIAIHLLNNRGLTVLFLDVQPTVPIRNSLHP